MSAAVCEESAISDASFELIRTPSSPGNPGWIIGASVACEGIPKSIIINPTRTLAFKFLSLFCIKTSSLKLSLIVSVNSKPSNINKNLSSYVFEQRWIKFDEKFKVLGDQFCLEKLMLISSQTFS